MAWPGAPPSSSSSSRPTRIRSSSGATSPAGTCSPTTSRWRRSVHDAYARGRLPVWMPEISGGRPLLAQSQRRRALSGPAAPGEGAVSARRCASFPPLHWALAALGIFRLLTALGATRPAAWVGAVTYAFSGVAGPRSSTSHILPGLALLPWILWARARPSRLAERRARSLLAVPLRARDARGRRLLDRAVGWAPRASGSCSRSGRSAGARSRGLVPGRRSRPRRAGGGSADRRDRVLDSPSPSARCFRDEASGVAPLHVSGPSRLLELVVPYPFGPTFALDPTEVWGRAVFFPKALGLFETLYCGGFAPGGRSRAWPGARTAADRDSPRWFLFLAVAAACLPSLMPQSWLGVPLPGGAAKSGEVRRRHRLRAGDPRGPRLRPVPHVGSVSARVLLAVRAPAGARRGRRMDVAPGRAVARAAASPSSPRRPPPRRKDGSSQSRWPREAFSGSPRSWRSRRLRRRTRAGTAAAAVALLTLVPIAANRRIAPTFSEDVDLRADPLRANHLEGRPERDVPDDGRLQLPSPARSWSSSMRPTIPAAWSTAAEAGATTCRALGPRAGLQLGFRRGRSLAASAACAGFRSPPPVNPDAQAFFGALSLRWSVHFRDQDAAPRLSSDRGRPPHRPGRTREGLSGRAPPDRLAGGGRARSRHSTPFFGLPPGHVAIETGAPAGREPRVPAASRSSRRRPSACGSSTEVPDPTWLFVLRGYWTHRTVLLDGSPVEDVPGPAGFLGRPRSRGQAPDRVDGGGPRGWVSRWGPLVAVLGRAGVDGARQILAAGGMRARALLLLLLLRALVPARGSPPETRLPSKPTRRRPAADWLKLEPVALLQRVRSARDAPTTRGSRPGAEFLKRFFDCDGIENEIVCPAPGRCNLLGAAAGPPARGRPAPAQPHRRRGGVPGALEGRGSLRGQDQARLPLRPRRLRHEVARPRAGFRDEAL